MKTHPLYIAITLTASLTSLLHADPADQGIVDTHFHAMHCKADGMDLAADWMKQNGVTRAISHPIGASRAKNDNERRAMLANFKKHQGKIERFCIIKPEEVGSVDEAVKILQQEKKDGAIGFGEHYGKGLMFDDPSNLRLFTACAEAGLPVMRHGNSIT